MSRLPFIGVIVAVGGLALATDLPLEDLGHPLSANKYYIAWECNFTNLPTELTVYEVVPKRFSHQVISNLVALAEFGNPSAALSALTQAAEGRKARYEERDLRKFLLLDPANGEVFLHNPGAIANSRPEAAGVPNDKQLLPLALEILAKLGVERSDLATQPGTDRPRMTVGVRVRGGRDKATGQRVEVALGRDVKLNRRINGIDCSAGGVAGAVWMEFGNYAKLATLEMAWRDLKPHKKLKSAGKIEIERWIRGGKAVTDLESDEAATVKRFVIKSITPAYLEKSRREPQKYVWPYAILSAVAEYGSTQVEAEIRLPIVMEQTDQ